MTGISRNEHTISLLPPNTVKTRKPFYLIAISGWFPED